MVLVTWFICFNCQKILNTISPRFFTHIIRIWSIYHCRRLVIWLRTTLGPWPVCGNFQTFIYKSGNDISLVFPKQVQRSTRPELSYCFKYNISVSLVLLQRQLDEFPCERKVNEWDYAKKIFYLMITKSKAWLQIS